MELYAEGGFEHTTVAEIAARAGLTERTFFRHFADKREVLFSGAVAFREFLVAEVDVAPPDVPPLEVVTAAFSSASDAFFEERRDLVRGRQAIIDANVELQERERIKMASVASTLADALHLRGVGEPAAGLAAEAGVVVFTIAFDEWVRAAGGTTLSERIWALIEELRALTAASAPGARHRR